MEKRSSLSKTLRELKQREKDLVELIDNIQAGRVTNTLSSIETYLSDLEDVRSLIETVTKHITSGKPD